MQIYQLIIGPIVNLLEKALKKLESYAILFSSVNKG